MTGEGPSFWINDIQALAKKDAREYLKEIQSKTNYSKKWLQKGKQQTEWINFLVLVMRNS